MGQYAEQIDNLRLIQELKNSVGRDGVLQTDIDALSGLIVTVADTIGPLLSRIPQTFKQYTEHDIGHCRNIIDLMGRFIPADTLKVLNGLELTVLILSALLHDTGMVVTDAEKEQVLLLTGDGSPQAGDHERWHAVEEARKAGNYFRGASPGLIANSFDHDNRIGNSGFGFDGNGNATTNSFQTFGYDIENHLTGISAYNFTAAYGPDDLRASKTINTASTYYITDLDGSPLLEETFSGGSATITQAHGFGADGKREVYVTPSALFYEYAFDPEGNLAERDQSANTLTMINDVWLYDSYGSLLLGQHPSMSAATPDTVGFGGQHGYYTDPESGLVLMTHRYYDPNTRRFLTRDPIGYKGGINLYGFCGNNPVMGSDPEGTSVNSPGFLESLIPVWGSGRESLHNFQTGHPYWGTFNAVMAVSDLFLAKAVIGDVAKVGIKGLVKIGGSHSWPATKKWIVNRGYREYHGQPFHHSILHHDARRDWRISDELWAKIEPLHPPGKCHPWGVHRSHVDNRAAMDAISYVLRTGCQWNALNVTGICSSSSAHRRFQEWADAGVFAKLWELSLQEYDAFKGLDWSWLAMDGAMTKAPLGGKYRTKPEGY